MTRREDRLFSRYRERGDPRDLGKVFDLTAPELLGVALHLTRDPELAEDVLQTTFLTALEDAAHWDANRPLRPWLIGILANRVRDLRRRTRRKPDPNRIGAEPTFDPGDHAATAELADAATRAVHDLHEPYRRVLILHLEHGLTAQEIADALQRPAGTVRTQITRGLEFVRDAVPAGLGAGAVLAVPTEGLLAAVKQQVLAGLAPSHVTPVAATAAAHSLLGGVLLMKSFWVTSLTVALIALAGVFALPSLTSDAPPPAPPEVAIDTAAPDGPAADRIAITDEASRVAASVPNNAVVPPPATSPTISAGTARIRVITEDGAPVPDLLLVSEGRGSVRTDAAGEASFAGLPLGQREVCIAIPQCSHNVWPTVSPVQESLTVVTIPRGLDVHGRVIDDHGQPVPGAQILTLGNFEFHAEVATAADDGTFVIRHLRQRQQLIARADGWQSSRAARPEAAPGERVDVVLRLTERATHARGVVRGPDGAPLAGAQLAIVHVGGFFEAPPLLLTSDANGAFATEQIAPGRNVVHALGARGDARFATVTDWNVVPHGLDGVTLGTQPCGVMFGRACDERGEAIPHRQVIARYRHPQVFDLPYARRHVYTDADGNYRVEGLVAGQFEAEFGDGASRIRRLLDVGIAQEVRWDPRAAVDCDLTIHIVDEAGQPLPRWRVDVLNQLGFPSHGQSVDAEGRATFERLRPHGNRFSLSEPVGENDERGLPNFAQIPNLTIGPIDGGGEHTVRVTRAQQSTAVIRGRVVTPDGTPLAGSVTIGREGDRDARESLRIDRATGGFESLPLSAGAYRVVVRADGRAAHALPVQELTPDTVLELGDVIVAEPGTLIVALAGATAAARVQLLTSAGATPLRRRDDGSFASGPLRPGKTYEVQLTGPAIAPTRTRVTIETGANELTLRGAPATPCRLVELLPAARPDRGHWSSTAEIRRAADGSLVLRDRASVRLEDATAHRFDRSVGLLPGRYTVEVSGWEGSSGRAEFEVSGPTGRSVEIRLAPSESRRR